MTIGQSSQQYNFSNQFSNFEMLVDAFERCGKSPSELTQIMLASGRRSLNLVLQKMANQGPSLWAIDLYTVILQQGVSTITLPANVSSVLDVYVRQYLNLATLNIDVSFTSNDGQSTVNIYQPNHGLLVGQSIYIVTPVSVGGLVLQGYYLVQNVPDQNDFTVTATSLATSSVANGGQVALFTTSISAENVSVNLPSHGLSVGYGFNVPVTTQVGGITLSGSYLVTTVTDVNNFIINSSQSAVASQSAYMNFGQVQINEQSSDLVPTDRVLTPMSRTDYSSLPYKAQQGFPYTYWVDRQIPSTMTFWETPDQNGPYILNAYYLRQLQDANLGMGEIPDVQYRGLEMITSRLSAKLAVKYAPDKYELLKAEADEEFGFWESEEREKVPMFIQPQIGRYFRGN